MSRRSTLVLVDGSNVARCGAWRSAHADAGSDHDLRRRLVDAAAGWAASSGHDVVVTFDGAGPWRPGRVRITMQLEVQGSGGAEGDDLIERQAALAGSEGRAYWLVSNDRALRMVAGAQAERTLDSDAFARLLTARPPVVAAADVDREGTVTAGPTRIVETLDADVRARLERMRRGDEG